jgi:hypothetical protein
VALTEDFDPDTPRVATDYARAVELRTDQFEVLFFDFPGHDEETWKGVYRNPVTKQLRTEYHDAIKAYRHPFIDDVISDDGIHLGYKFVMQYWFYYPLKRRREQPRGRLGAYRRAHHAAIRHRPPARGGRRPAHSRRQRPHRRKTPTRSWSSIAWSTTSITR